MGCVGLVGVDGLTANTTWRCGRYGIPITDSEGDSEDEEDDGAAAAPVLSRREREEVEKQEADRKYQSLHAAGKTEEAQAGHCPPLSMHVIPYSLRVSLDLARLKAIREQRAEAKAKREAQAALKAAKQGK